MEQLAEIERLGSERFTAARIAVSLQFEIHRRFAHVVVMRNSKTKLLEPLTVDRNYMYLYSISLFHLWTVGVWQPYCHNQIESMSCGAIPLFQDFPYYPGLINGFNCISYSDFSGLCNEVNKILEGNIPRNELLLMSSRINELYNTHYSKKAIKLAFDSFVEDSNIIQEDYYICPKEN